MSSISYISGDGVLRYRDTISGTGTTADPDIPAFGSLDIGLQADAAATTDTGTFSLISLFKRLLSSLTSNVGLQADAAATSDTGSFSLISLFKRLLSSLTSNVGLQADTAATTDTGSFSLISLFKRLLTIVSRPNIVYANDTLTATTDTQIVAAPGAGVSVYITHLVVQNITTTATTVNVKHGTTTVLSFLLQTQGASQVIAFPQRRDFKLTANTALNLQATTANSITYSVGYFTGA